jgi:hypothetical protein
VQADLGTVARLERADQVASPHRVAFDQRRANRLVARQDGSRMRDREHIPVDDKSDEVHDAVGGRVNIAARRDVDPAVSGRILRGWRQERSHDLVHPANRPRPARLRCRGGRSRQDARGNEPEDENEAKHPTIVCASPSERTAGRKTFRNRSEMRPVGERC